VVRAGAWFLRVDLQDVAVYAGGDRAPILLPHLVCQHDNGMRAPGIFRSELTGAMNFEPLAANGLGNMLWGAPVT